ncbi:MAG: serine hydrolase domain-containing protein, partial [Crocinitomicaceae bacterium]
QLKQASIAVFSLHSKDNNQLISEIPETIKNEFQVIKSDVLIVFGNSSSVRNQNLECFSSVVLAHENHEIAQRSTAQALLGALEIKGQQNGHLSMQTNGRLKFSTPQEVGIDSSYIKKIEEIALGGIKAGAYPGCQVLVAVNNKIILNNSYGYHTYEKNAKKVENDDLYDIASITKIAASTLLTMKLHSEGKFDLSKTLGDYLEETKNT